MDWTEKAREFLEQHKFIQAAHIASFASEVERLTRQGNNQRYGYEGIKHCCTVCASKNRCHVCGDPTQMACSDCRIDLQTTVFVCSKKSCRDEHETKCRGTAVKVGGVAVASSQGGEQK